VKERKKEKKRGKEKKRARERERKRERERERDEERETEKKSERKREREIHITTTYHHQTLFKCDVEVIRQIIPVYVIWYIYIYIRHICIYM